MSFLLTTEQFMQARLAVRDGSITDDLYRWLGSLVAVSQLSRALAPAAVPGGRWDDPDAVAETVHAWLEESLLRGALLSAFDTCETPRALARYLERSLRNWLISRSRRRCGPRLLERAAELMERESEFRVVRDHPSTLERWWGLLAWEQPELFAGREQDVVSASWALGDFAILRYSSSERSDPVLSTPDLVRYLSGLLERIDRALNGRLIDRTFRSRFAYAYDVGGVSLDEANDLADPQATPSDQAQLAAAARIALGALTGRQVRVLLERPTGTLEELAQRLQVSRGTIDNEYRRAILKVREASPTDDTLGAVLETVLLLASGGENT